MQQQDYNEIFIKVILSLLTVLAAFLVIRSANLLLTKTAKKSDQDKTLQAEENIIFSAKVLFKTLLSYAVFLGAAIIILEIFQVKLISTEDLKNIGVIVLKVGGILIAAKLALSFGRLAIQQVFNRKDIKDNFITNRRAQTLESLLKNIITYLVFFVATIMILQAFNVNTSAILASAGILGLAVGFGAQNMFKDIISGFFIIFEDQFAVGDYVEAGGAVGLVEEIGLRTCKIRQWTGQLHIIPNGEIKKITNYNRGHMMAVAEVGIAYEEDIDRTIEVLRGECEDAHREIQSIVEVPVVQGVVSLGDFAVNIRTVAVTIPGSQWQVERELLRRFKNALDKAGIEIPYPRRVVTYREEYTKLSKEENLPQ